MEALTGAKTHAQIASEYGISPDLVTGWKKQAKDMLGECFRRGGRKSETEKKDERIANLEHFWRTYKHEFFLHREPMIREEAIEMTSEWME